MAVERLNKVSSSELHLGSPYSLRERVRALSLSNPTRAQSYAWAWILCFAHALALVVKSMRKGEMSMSLFGTPMGERIAVLKERSRKLMSCGGYCSWIMVMRPS